MQAVAGHEHETACRRRPAVIAAEPGQLTLEQVEHLVLARVHMRMDQQPWRIERLHHAELPERVIPGRLDHDLGTMEIVSRALIRSQHEPVAGAGHD